MNANVKTLPSALTSYDLLKTFALLTMVIDHIGFCFYPEAMWWRAVGRLSAPAWLFLIGYANSRDFSPRLWIAAIVLIFASGLFGPTVFPISILVTILCVRLVLDKLCAVTLQNALNFIVLSLVIALLAIPTVFVLDYGAVALSVALFGAVMRRKVNGERMFQEAPLVVGLTAYVFYSLIMVLLFDFSKVQDFFVFGGGGLVFLALYFFKPAQYSGFTAKAPKIFVTFLQFCGRRTLAIYVVHILLFKMLAVYLGVEGFALLDFQLD